MMNAELKACKQTLRAFLREHYTDERLSWLLAHARDGKLNFSSCCCFIGVLTADHALQSEAVIDLKGRVDISHVERARLLPGAPAAEHAYLRLRAAGLFRAGGDAVSRRRLIPIIQAELKRREAARRLAEMQFETASV